MKEVKCQQKKRWKTMKINNKLNNKSKLSNKRKRKNNKSAKKKQL